MKVLVVVDYQNDFVDGALGFPGAEELGPRIAAKVRAYREAGDLVVWTLDTHSADYADTQEGRKLPVPHCIEGTAGHALHPSVAGEWHEGDPTFCKPGFGSWELGTWLRELAAGAGAGALESVEFVGLVSNICVVTNVALVKAACPEVPLIVDASCTASNDPRLNAAALDVMESIQVQVTNRTETV